MSCYIIHICSFSKYVFFYWCLIVLELWFSFTGENFGNRRFLSFKKFQSSQVPNIVFYIYLVLNNVFLWFEIWHVPKAIDFFKYININNLQLQFIAYVVSLASKYGGSVVNNLPASAGNVSSITGSGRSPGEGNGNLLLPGKSHEQRSLTGYSPWGYKRVGHDLVTKQQPQWLYYEV